MTPDDGVVSQRFEPYIFAVEFNIYVKPKNDSTMKRRILFSVLCVLAAAGAFAQGQGLAGINEATSLMTSYFDPATKLCYAIGAVLGLVGGIKLVLRLHLPDCGRHHSPFLLPISHGLPYQQRSRPSD